MDIAVLLSHWWLVPTTFFTAIITAVSGAGGGILLLGLMGLVLPGTAVIPLHGAVMFLQNGLRGVLLFKHVDWRFVGIAGVGSVLGALLAGPVAVNLNDNAMQLLLGLGLLYLIWAPKPKKPLSIPFLNRLNPDVRTAIMAILISMVTILIGAAGVLFSAIRRRGGLPKEAVLADQSFIMLCQHILKMLVFGLAGFVFGPYLPLIIPMVCMGLLGTFVGVVLMKKMSSHVFDIIFKAVVTVLAIAMLAKAANFF